MATKLAPVNGQVDLFKTQYLDGAGVVDFHQVLQLNQRSVIDLLPCVKPVPQRAKKGNFMPLDSYSASPFAQPSESFNQHWQPRP